MKATSLLYSLLLSLVSFFPTLAQDIPTEAVGDQTINTNSAVYFDAQPSAEGVYSLLAAPTLPEFSTFDLSTNGVHGNPPDCSGAVSSSNVVSFVNFRFTVHTKAGVELSDQTIYTFWGSGLGPVISIYDPMIAFDPKERRFIATCAHDSFTTNAGILIAVSLTEDPLGQWNKRRFAVDANAATWGDQPHIGFNDRFIVISANMFRNVATNGALERGKIWVFDKTNLYAGNYSAPLEFYSGNQSFWPAANYDGSTNQFLLSNISGNSQGQGLIGIGFISGSGTNTAFTLGGTNFIRTTNTWVSSPQRDLGIKNFAPQAGVTNLVNTMDARMHSVLEKGGYVYGVQSIFVPATNPTRSILQFYQYRSGQIPKYTQIDDGSSHYAFPNLAVNDFGDVIIGYAKFTTNGYPSAAYRIRYYNDLRFTAEQVFATGTDYYVYNDAGGRNRWGDYTTSVVDPANNRDFWTLGEFSTTRFGANLTFSGRYGLRWANVLMPAPTNDNFANAITLSGPSGTNGIVMQRLTREAGEPQHLGTNLVSMWYNWTATNSGQVTFFPGSSGIAIAVYTGSSVSGLTSVAQSSIGSSSSLRPLTPRATFIASSGATYRIALVMAPGGYATTSFWWEQPVAPTIVQQPNPPYNEVVDGFSLTLTAIASGNPLPTLQWQRNGVNVSGATGTNYTIASMTTNDAGTYRLIATNSSGSVTSEVSSVTYFSSAAWPLDPGHWTNSVYKFSQQHVVGYEYIVFGTTNLTDWVALKTNTVPFDFTDESAPNYPYGFYRTQFKP